MNRTIVLGLTAGVVAVSGLVAVQAAGSPDPADQAADQVAVVVMPVLSQSAAVDVSGKVRDAVSDAKKKAEAEARRKAAEEARRQAEEAARQAEEAARQAEEEAAAAQSSSGGSSSYTGGAYDAAYEGTRQCIVNKESGGNYSIVSSNGLWHGAYQFTVGTSSAAAQQMGRPDLVGVPASQWAPADQDAAFWTIWNHGAGRGNWPTAAGC